MLYVYDILLNFNKNLIEFFEWDSTDDIKYVRKIPVFAITENEIKDFILYDVAISNEFSTLIDKKALFYDDEMFNIALLTDGKICIGINVLDNKVCYISHMLLDEEQDVLKLYKEGRIPKINMSYKKLLRKNDSNNLYTRYEKKIMDNLYYEFTQLYKDKNYEKLNYFYYEYFNEEALDIECAYNSLVNSLNNFNEKHKALYNIIMLSYENNKNI